MGKPHEFPQASGVLARIEPGAKAAARRAVLLRYGKGQDDASQCYTILDALGLLAPTPRILPLTPSGRAKAAQKNRAAQMKKNSQIEVRLHEEGVDLLDASRPETALHFTYDEWNAFLAGVKQGEFDPIPGSSL